MLYDFTYNRQNKGQIGLVCGFASNTFLLFQRDQVVTVRASGLKAPDIVAHGEDVATRCSQYA